MTTTTHNVGRDPSTDPAPSGIGPGDQAVDPTTVDSSTVDPSTVDLSPAPPSTADPAAAGPPRVAPAGLGIDGNIYWGHDRLGLVIAVAPDRAPSIVRITSEPTGFGGGPAAGTGDQAISLVEIHSLDEGRGRTSQGLAASAVGARLRYGGHRTERQGRWLTLVVDSHDETTGITAATRFRTRAGISTVQVDTTLTMSAGQTPVTLIAVTSLAVGAIPHVVGPAVNGAPDLNGVGAGFHGDAVDRLQLIDGRSEWLAEGRWTCRPVRDVLPRLDLPLHGQDGRGHYVVDSHGSWPTGESLPTGVLLDRLSGAALAWQVETNGPWQWELTDHRAGIALTVCAATDLRHQWRHRLTSDRPFRTPPASLAVTDSGGWERAVEALTEHRRALWSDQPGPSRSSDLPIVYNDFMNTLMADPTQEKVLSLARAAAAAGAEVYCIDAGWYDDGDDWWDSVGEWQPSLHRFPNGLAAVIAAIADLGLTPGLWLEPEVIGVRSSTSETLPGAAFFQRDGVRVREHGRYHLDFSHPAAVAHADAIVDRMIREWGVGFIKLDYNINPGVGTDRGQAESPGAGLLAHQRGYLQWLDDVRARHPELILEGCASGAMRMDYATLLRHDLQSTSDQQNALLYPPIAASAPMSVAPELCGNWAYPQPEMTDAEIAFTMVTGLAGRVYLAGFLDRMSPEQLELVAEGLAAHRGFRDRLPAAQPFWPLGLPRWDDPWVALGYRTSTGERYLTIWHRPGSAGADVSLTVSGIGPIREVETLYPSALVPRIEANATDDGLRLTGRDFPTAVFLRLS